MPCGNTENAFHPLILYKSVVKMWRGVETPFIIFPELHYRNDSHCKWRNCKAAAAVCQAGGGRNRIIRQSIFYSNRARSSGRRGDVSVTIAYFTYVADDT
ncbi:hypothetical protein GWI33_005782 [Rhynchophorus ferrugineus]|uniref:Uncharacterized protein n=1 Tax=Rhynchophorus ferrugineus TaxID=354439 RepID=A0A834IUK3_RHYFE|nr:hypothetical protein GWI33_005782 [Rhynchophorus ferrugineus]